MKKNKYKARTNESLENTQTHKHSGQNGAGQAYAWGKTSLFE